ncbi:STAS domain-containing protein [Halomonas sp. OfavH-34-E]|uniref:STAS domain-containing protein n=1 Tax=Halomonas sp. OfavH-34-E TaxID=2954491 RepID=UPI002096D84B|nr:STAS domain-containing protein [Halomonas sp. OfavH-34-E]
MSVLMEVASARLLEDGSTLRVCGKVDFDGAADMAEAGREWLQSRASGTSVCLDLSEVEHVSSAALTMMLEWARTIRQIGLSLNSIKLSAQLRQLTELAGLDDLLPSSTVTA